MMLPLNIVRTCLSIVCSSWMAAFITGRVALFHQWYTVHHRSFGESMFIWEEICRNDTMKANLGEHVRVCDQAVRTLAIWPGVQAIYSTAAETYLCGDTSCTELFRDMTASWSSFIVTVALTLAISPVLYRKAIGWCFNKAVQQRVKNNVWDSHPDDRMYSDDRMHLPNYATPVIKEHQN
jgi:hypothetical protein